MNKKSLYKVLSIIMVVALVLPALPAKIIKAAENSGENLTGEETVVSPAAIKTMAEDMNTTLNLMDGIITVTDRSYVQKTSSGTIISQGDITGELILTGIQPSAWDVTLNGSNIPTIRFKNASLEGAIKGSFTCALNLIIEGECTFNNMISPTNTIPKITVTGEGGSLIKGYPMISILGMITDIELYNLTFDSGNNQTSIKSSGNILIKNCKSLQTPLFTTTSNTAGKTLTIEDCDFVNLQMNPSADVFMDNVTVRGGDGTLSFYGNETIKNSTINLSRIEFRGTANKVIDSTIYLHYAGTAISSYNTVSLKGSTIIDSSTSAYNWYIYTNSNVIIDDCSIILKGVKTSTNRFYSSITKTVVDPINSENKPLFLNKLKVPGASDSFVTVSVDGQDNVNLGTDTDGYLYLYLPTGEHTIKANDKNGYVYEKTFTAMEARETTSNPNIIGELAPAKPSTNIKTPYGNKEIQYSFDNNNWNNAVTDETGYFKAVIPDNAVRIYIKLVETGENKHAIISDGIVGEFYDDKPIITEQSSSNLTFIKGQQGTIYVTAEPYIMGDTLTYQWYKDNEILPGKTSPVLHLITSQVSDAGIYTCIITESDGRTIASIPITVIIDESQLEVPGELTLISQSTGKTLIKGYSTELYVTAKPSLSTKTLTYQWFKDGEEITGATESKISLNSVQIEDSGTFICRVYEDSKYIDSAPIPVMVEENPLEDDIADLTKQVSNLTSQVGTLTGQLNAANQEKANLQTIVSGLESQIVTYTNQISELLGNIADLDQQLADAEGNKDALNQTIIVLNNQIHNLNQQITSLQADLETINEQKEVLENTIINLRNDIVNLNSQITLLEGKLADSQAENTELKNQVSELHNTISRLETEVTNFQNDMDSLTEHNNQLINQVESLTNQNEDLQDEIQRLQDLLDAANGTIHDLTKQVNDLTTEVNFLKEQLNTVNGDKAALQGTITNLENQITILNGQIDGLNNHVSELEDALEQEGADKDTLNQTIIELNSQITNLNQTVTNLQNQLNSVTEERNSLQSTVTELNNQITDLNEQITIITNKLEDSEEEKTQLVNRVTELQNTVSGLENDITNLQGDLETLHNSNTALQGQLDTANDTITSLNALFVLIKGELGVINNEDIIPAIRQLKAQLQQEKDNNELLQKQLDELNTELNTARDNNSVLISKLQELMNLVGSENQEGIKEKIIKLQNSLKESESRVIELEKVKSDLMKDLQEAENLNKSLQQKIDELLQLGGSDVEEIKKQVLALTEQINRLIQNNQELQESINDLKLQVTDLNSEKAQLESEIVRLETLLNTANSTIDELRQQLADMAAGKTNLENENAALKQEIGNLKQQLENSNDHSGSSNGGSSSNTKEVKELQDKLDQALSDLENTKKELEQIQHNSGVTDGTESDNTDNRGNTGSTEIKIPENSVVVLHAETVNESVIKESADKPIKKDKIEAEEGWEIAPTLVSKWGKEIDLIDVVGQSNKKENVDISFYARKEDKPEQVYTETMNVEKPVAIPNFTMDKLIYLGSEFNLNVANVPKNAMITYKSANSSIAKINKVGTITPVKPGKTKITGTLTKDGIPYQFTINVTVKDGEYRTLNLKDQAIQMSANNPVLMVYKLVNKGKTTKIDLNGYADNATVTYISSDRSIATVNKDGVIKGNKKGNTTITATLAQNDTIYIYIIKVRVDDGTEDDSMWDYLTA
ncbi:hypothetical protein Ana3638_20540 [Anaerocolumna sedimenticola]|uniref:Ig-like domain-containing protein n=1 Tax=Anaerocolumna sedimenticola TaxID=2696063 RepID=A0A6P1TRK1_9FIRM|nr:Ig-like domain-containing protein [Anaerocolumna sedimenticola]QHQ62872.1 hypothetical protein Ana3638_20540 [Anaerocolumna sedimenticola]